VTGGGATDAFGAAISGTVEIGSAVATGATLSIVSSGATLCTSVGGRRSGGVVLGFALGGLVTGGRVGGWLVSGGLTEGVTDGRVGGGLVTEGGGVALGRLGGFVLGKVVEGGVAEGREGGVADGRSGNRMEGNCTDGKRIEGVRDNGGSTCVGVMGAVVPRVGGLVDGTVEVAVRTAFGNCDWRTSGGVFRIVARGGVVEPAVVGVWAADCASAIGAPTKIVTRSAATPAKFGFARIGPCIPTPPNQARPTLA
jgi:hypothetical protein